MSNEFVNGERLKTYEELTLEVLRQAEINEGLSYQLRDRDEIIREIHLLLVKNSIDFN